VASLVLEDGGGEDEAIAALLHDAVEDGKATIGEIRERFGDGVGDIVMECSDTEGEDEKPPWRGRKERYIAHLATASDEALRVSNADKVHNVRSMLADYREVGEALWERFNEDANSAEVQLWYYDQLVQAFRDRRGEARLVNELARTVNELRNAVSGQTRSE
jgi:(p)ppGpp synthase/HD superfamily hydrolase